MVEVIHILHTDPNAASVIAGPYTANVKLSARVEIHSIERVVSGYTTCTKIYGEIKIAAREAVWAHELKLSTIRMMLLTPENTWGAGAEWSAKVYIRSKGQFDNWASIDIYDDAGAYITPGHAQAQDNGSVWLAFMALGE